MTTTAISRSWCSGDCILLAAGFSAEMTAEHSTNKVVNLLNEIGADVSVDAHSLGGKQVVV